MAKTNKEKIIIFRVTNQVTTKLKTELAEVKPVGVKSVNQFARKVLLDYAAGNLVYVNPQARRTVAAG